MLSSARSGMVMVAATVLVAGGCASIISGRTATVNIDSNPSQANVVIRDKHGKEVLTTHTPATVELKRKDRFIWPARYTATLEKPGFQAKTVAIRPTINPWILGNVVAGGVIGLAVDNVTGAAWKPQVASLHPTLEPLYTAHVDEPSSSESERNVRPAAAIY
jgi:hypothetical protein